MLKIETLKEKINFQYEDNNDDGERERGRDRRE